MMSRRRDVLGGACSLGKVFGYFLYDESSGCAGRFLQFRESL